MKELGLFVGNNDQKYIGYYNHQSKEVEILGPLGDQGKSTLGQFFVKNAETESKAVEVIIRTINNIGNV